MKVQQYAGYELALGSVYAVRWFTVDDCHRLRGPAYKTIIKPGENVATCKNPWLAGGVGIVPAYIAFPKIDALGRIVYNDKPVAPKPTHDVLMDEACSCGFYAYAADCDEGNYAYKVVHDSEGEWVANESNVRGIVECYGKTVLGTKGLRCEKMRVVALVNDGQERVRFSHLQKLYPSVLVYNEYEAALRDFQVIEPFLPTPESVPDFWDAE